MNEISFKMLLSASGLSHTKAADLISLHTSQIFDERDIRAWLVYPDKKGRACPPWVMKVMLDRFSGALAA